MTNEELLATAEVALLKAERQKQDTYDLRRAINTLEYCMERPSAVDIDFARAVLLTEIEELKIVRPQFSQKTH
jgi:hypothetical protein